MSLLDQRCIDSLRGLAMDAPRTAGSGHSGTAMACAPIGWTLFAHCLRHNPGNPAWPDRDRFILSNGHACVLLYGLLYLTGYDLSLDDLKRYRTAGSRTPSHPESWVTPGVDATTGPLGQGLAMGVGMAVAERFLAAHFNRPQHAVVNHYTYVLCSDGDLMEGVSGEASSLAGHLGLGKLICLYDDNRMTIDGPTDLSMSEDVQARYRAYGWHVEEVRDGNDPTAIESALSRAREDSRPTLVAVRTEIGFPSPNFRNTPAAHSPPLPADEILRVKELLGLSPEPFHFPAEVLEHGRAARARGDHRERAWRTLWKSYRERYPDLEKAWDEWHESDLPPEVTAGLESLAEDKPVATRVASARILQHLAARIPNLLGGSADLTESTGGGLPREAPHTRECPSGRALHFGVREHAMGAILNGMAAHGGVRPFGSTYFVFSDYLRPALRLAALARLPTIHVWTHDSIGLGEDGPTHQPVEHLASLRAMPNFYVIRPCDAAEVAEAWRVALGLRHSPVGLVLTRSTVPWLDRSRLTSASGLTRGGYILGEAQGGLPTVVLIGTGSEVHLCLDAQRILEAEGTPTRVVSLPCWELFEEQEQEYRDRVLPPEVTARVAVEAGSGLGWHRWVGDRGAVLALSQFGVCASGRHNFEKFGFSAPEVASLARRQLVSRL